MRSIVLLLVAALAALPAAAGIHNATYELGRRDNGRIHAWLYFTDKPQSLARSSNSFLVTEKALSRRARRGDVGPEQARQLDRPVSPDYLRQVRETGATIRRVSRWLNAASVSATPEQLDYLAQLACVDRIEPVRLLVRPPLPVTPAVKETPPRATSKSFQRDYGPSLNQLLMLNVPAVHDLGYSGKGITVLMLDTGFYKEHEAIEPGRILAEYDFLEDDRQTQNETTAEDSIGQHNHGTYTYTALGGYSPGNLIAPAYECSLLLAKTESIPDEFQGEEDNYVAGLEWGDSLGADIVSSSLGYMDWYSYQDMDGNTAVTTQAVRWATRLGMLVVTAAGNERYDTTWGGYIIAPADADSILTVGAVNATGQLAAFSSHGPTFDGRIKPEVVAQGIGVRCAQPSDSAYTFASGTSMSTPLVAGSAALLLQAHPTWRPEDVRAALMATARQADSPDNDLGWGIPDVLAALNYNTTAVHNDGDKTDGRSYAVQLENAYPNPLAINKSQRMVIMWTLPHGTTARLDIYNLLGQHVVNLYAGHSSALGQGSALWNGVDKKGRPVTSGIYLIRLTAGDKAIVKRITIER